MLTVAEARSRRRQTIPGTSSSAQNGGLGFPFRAPVKARGGLTRCPAAVPAVKAVTQGNEVVVCIECGKVLFSDQREAVRVREGSTRYSTKTGATILEPAFPQGWLHLHCCLSKKVEVESYRRDICVLCGGQFYGIDSDEPDETVLEFTRGSLVWVPKETEPKFSGSCGGMIHWGCAHDFTRLTVCE